VLARTALPALPARVAWPLGIGAWTNAMSFGVLTAWPDLQDHPAYRAGVVGSFVATSTGFVGLAAEGRPALAARPLAPARPPRRTDGP
jgi:hypothetical protein